MSDESAIDVKLDIIIGKLHDVCETLHGDGSDDKPGMKIEVDRLKRSRATHNAVLWVLFTTGLTITSGVIVALLTT